MYICIDIYNLDEPNNNNIIRNTPACILLLLYGFRTTTCLNYGWGGLGNVRLITSRTSTNNKLKATVQRGIKIWVYFHKFLRRREKLLYFSSSFLYREEAARNACAVLPLYMKIFEKKNCQTNL